MKGLSKGAVQVFVALVLVLGGYGLMAPVAKADPGSISGVVNATGGGPIPGATVQLYVYSSLLPGALPSRVQAGSTTTNATGHYTITPTPAMAGPYGILARYPSKATEWYKLPDNTYNMYEAQSVADGATGINFSLENGVSISGRVTDNVTGSGVNGASISVALHSSLAPGMQRMYYDGATTNATGHYTITTLPPGYTFGVQARALSKATEWWQDTYNVYQAAAVPANSSNIDFSLEQGGTISGYVYEQDGSTPIVGATVSTAEWSSLTSGQRTSYDGATTITGGAYTISSLPPGADHLFGVQARASGRASEWYKTPTTGTYFASEAVSVATPASGVNISLDPGGSILGRVTVTAGGLGIPNASISVVLHSSLTTSPRKYFDGGRTLSDGTYTVSGLPAGYVVGVQARASDYASEWWNGKYTLPADQVTVLAAGTPDINFSLEAGGSISGVVTKTLGGGGISGASINVFVHSSVISGGSWVSYDGATTGTSGSYTVSGLPAGDVAVRATAAGYATEFYEDTYFNTLAKPVSITPGSPKTVNFSLEPGADISGVVTSGVGAPSPGTPISGATVVAVPDPPTGTAWSTTTGAVGTYTLSGLPLGNYLVSAFAKDYARQFYYGHDFAAQAENVTLGSGGRSDVNFQLKYGAGRILGHVYGACMAPVNQAQLEAYLLVGDSWIVAYRARSSSDGSYVMPSVLPGSYRVKAFPSGYVPEWYQGTYVEGAAKLVPVTTFADTIDIDFTLEPTPVAEAGGPYLAQAGVPVTLNGVAFFDSARPIVSWDWDFGDGATGNGASANHTYQAAGIYTAELTVTDTMGAQATDTATVVIWSYCFADQERGTKLYINTSDQTFQFIAPDKEFAVKKATRMEVIDLTKVSAMIYDARTKKWRIDSKKLSLDNDIKPFVELQRWDNKPDKIILIFHRDEELMLSALVLDGTQDSCVAVAKDMKTSKFYILIDRPDLKRLK